VFKDRAIDCFCIAESCEGADRVQGGRSCELSLHLGVCCGAEKEKNHRPAELTILYHLFPMLYMYQKKV